MRGRYRPFQQRIVWILLMALVWSGATPLADARLRRRATTGRPSPSRPHRVRASEADDSERGGAKADSFERWTQRAIRAEAALGEHWSVDIEDLDSTETLFQYQSARRLAPASNRKLITMGLALETLGPDYHFQTEFGLSVRPEPGSSHYHGDLILRANGDPSLTEPFLKGNRNPSEIFHTWAQALHKLGVAYVHGDLVIDASAFGGDQNTYPESWSPTHRNYSYASIPAALTMDQNLLKVSVFPSRPGLPGRVSVFPSIEGLSVVNHTRTFSRGQNGVSAIFAEDATTLMLNGSLSMRGGEEVATVPLPHPLQYIGQLLRQSLEDAGIRQTGELKIKTVRVAGDTPTAPLAERIGIHESPPLSQLLLVMMRQSNNFLAEQLWRASAAKATGLGDVPNARQVELEWYKRHGLSWIEPGWDGSGLSLKDQFAATELVRLMRYLYHTANRNLILYVLPTSGRSGTLRHRSPGSIGARVTAKTGTLSGVSSLTGFIRDREGNPRLVFSMIGNAHESTHGRLSGRINELLCLAVNRLDADIDAGRRPRSLPRESYSTVPINPALDTLSEGSFDSVGGEPSE